VTFHNEVVVDVPIDPLAEAAPVYDRPQKEPSYLREVTQEIDVKEPVISQRSIVNSQQSMVNCKECSYLDVIHALLSSPTIASKKWVYRQYDHMVMTGTVEKPGSDAAIVRVGDSNKAVCLTTNCNSRYVYLNPKVGGQIAVAESGRNIVCSGGTPLAVTDCLNFGNPERPEIMWQFVQACEGLAEACREFNTPVVSGNVSLYNETNEQSIYPTPTIGMVGLLKDLNDRIGGHFEHENDVIILLGETYPEIGGSEYVKMMTGQIQGPCPRLDFDAEKTLWKSVHSLNQKNLIKSAHDLSEGGLIVSLFESSFPQNMGFKIEIHSDLRADHFLFGESQSRILISIAKESIRDVLSILKKSEVPYLFIGDVRKNQATLLYNNKTILDDSLIRFKDSYETGFVKKIFKS